MKKILFIISLILFIILGMIGYRTYMIHATYPDKLILKLSPFHNKIKIDCAARWH
jgi:uncharacterized membrane protein YedE/YeeE